MLKPISVTPSEDFVLELTMSDQTRRTFDVKPYLHLGKFRELRDIDLFRTVRIAFDTVAWSNGIDLDPELFASK